VGNAGGWVGRVAIPGGLIRAQKSRGKKISYDIAITNIVWCEAYEGRVRGGGILRIVIA